VWSVACTPPTPPSPEPAHAAPPAPIYEEEIKPAQKLEIAIIDLTETPSTDKKTVTVSGVLVNRGTRATRAVYVHVEALDRDGAVLVSADSELSSEIIAPGATGHFSVTLENRADVDRYYVEAISR
jgi:hypothetical protein